MLLVTKIIATLVGIEFLYIMYLETFATTSAKTGRVFNMDKEQLQQPAVKTLFKNQGVYNGLLAVLIFVAIFAFASKAAVIALMLYIVGVALYGSFTSDATIILKQGGLAIITLITCFF